MKINYLKYGILEEGISVLPEEKLFIFFPTTHLIRRGYQQQFSTKSHLHGPGKEPQRCYSSQPALGRVGAAGPHWPWPNPKAADPTDTKNALNKTILCFLAGSSYVPFLLHLYSSPLVLLALLNTAVNASLLSICCFHTKMGLKTLLSTQYVHEAVQHTSYMRNLEIRVFGEAQETFTRSSKLLMEMLTASLKTTESQLKTNCIRNIYSHTIEDPSTSRKVP